MNKIHTLLYIPNLIGYFRICLLVLAWHYFDDPIVFLTFYVIQVLLDAVDGWTARYFNQVSKFGEFLDIVIDNIGRGILWTRIASIGIFITSIEWITFVALNNHGSDWKLKLSSSNDLIVRNALKNGFQTPFGFLIIVLGTHGLPIIMYMMKYRVIFEMSYLLLHIIHILCIIGRLFSFYCEIYVIFLFISEDLLK
ncbi:unnamed protein product [Rotaria magnacalcarata]|uniref:CDP-diacylglycerol--inositol 3-phosphatidyltransferase n=2 Tax=Rotaria magnacalcarata TaxID=392030 RepID=A0A814VGW2_9BILA|nr:unnamed protein product [Rotaria magnacalcarata]CAF2032874.1 unnamed protein product [Rotaria magnacalcarata]CAF2118631.1 unnamed protein product [Rotaria magnacalcarata]CAF3794177.1 unnamed protein product [Rotaria magnacalcarata]